MYFGRKVISLWVWGPKTWRADRNCQEGWYMETETPWVQPQNILLAFRTSVSFWQSTAQHALHSTVISCLPQLMPKPAPQNIVSAIFSVNFCFNSAILWGRNGQRLRSRYKFSRIDLLMENNQRNELYYVWISRQKFKILDDGLLYRKQNIFFPPESSCECLEKWRGVSLVL